MDTDIDLYLVGKCEKWSHRIQQLTGFDCFFLARLFLQASLWSFILMPVFFPAQYAFPICITHAPIMLLWYFFILPKAEKRARIHVFKGGSNPSKLEQQMLRYMLCIALMIHAGILPTNYQIMGRLSAYFLISNLLFVIHVYFSACDPLPPAKSKVRKWLESALGAVKRFFTPVPELIPVPVPSR